MRNSFTTAKGTVLPISIIKGKEYLEVKYRVVWFREERPSWSIETQLVAVTDKSCLAKATIRDEQGRVISTSHKFEDRQGFADFIEKSETSAVGRALALIGYGTQFCADDLDEGDRLADSPVQSNGRVYPDQPGDEDGDSDAVHVWQYPVGSWKSRCLIDVERLFGLQKMRDWVVSAEERVAKARAKSGGQPVDKEPLWLEAIERTAKYIGDRENAPISE